MIDVSNWIPFLKIDENGERCMAQQTYEPLFNKERTVFCANYDWQNKYQRLEDSSRPLYTKEAVDYFFNQEVDYILKYQSLSFMPTLLDIDYNGRKIFFKWHGETCNEIIYTGKNLSDYCPNWKDQIKDIELGLYNLGTYKLTMYPHCHFIDVDGYMKAIDWYGCISTENPYVESKYMDSIIHGSAKFRLEETGAIIDSKYNLEIMFQRSMQEHVRWGDQNLEYIYKEIFNA